MKDTVEQGHLSQYVHWIEKLTEEEYTSLDIAAALLKIAVTSENKEDTVEDDYNDTGAAAGMVRLFINVGRNHRIKAKDIVGSIASNTGISGRVIGTIDIYDKYTFVEVPREYAREVLVLMKDNSIKGSKINIEPANRK